MGKKSFIMTSLLLISSSSLATDLTYGFKDPSFSGVNTSAHWLTIDNQEHTRSKEIADAIQAA